MGFFNSVTVDIDKLIRNKKDGKQHIIQFELKDKGKASSDVIASYDIYAMGTVDKILGKMLDAGERFGGIIILIVDMQVVVFQRPEGLLREQIVVHKWLGTF